MKAIRVHAFGGPEVLRFEDTPDPIPGPGQVLIDVKAVGINPVDTYVRAGSYGPKEFPYIPGSDGAGIVERVNPPLAAGSAAPPLAAGYPNAPQPGDRVYFLRAASGAYAQKAVVDLHNVHPLPDDLTFAQGAAVGVPYGTAHRAMFHRGQIKPGESVLVHGATGGVGIAAVQLAAALGCVVIGTGGSNAGRVLVLEQGANHVLDHNDASYADKLMDLTAGRGVDLILEMLANVNLAKDLTLLAKKGRVVVIGSRGKIEIDPRDTMSRDADIRGMSLMHASVDELSSIFAQITAGLANRTLRPIIDIEMPLSGATKAHVEVMEGGSKGKIVLIP